MKESIDLYAKMVIGTFSFIGPSFSLLIPLFYKAIQKSQVIHKDREKKLEEALVQLEQIDDDFQRKVKRDNNKLKGLRKQNERELNLLMPRRQVRRLFISLFGAILFIQLYYWQISHHWHYGDILWLRITSLGISGCSFVYCIRVLWQIFCTIIRIKTEESKQAGNIRLRNYQAPNPINEDE